MEPSPLRRRRLAWLFRLAGAGGPDRDLDADAKRQQALLYLWGTTRCPAPGTRAEPGPP